MGSPCVFMLPTPPSVNNLYIGTGKNKRHARHYDEWITRAGLELNQQKPLPYYDEPIEITIHLSRAKNRDIDNYLKALLDLIKSKGHGHGIIRDDSLVERIAIGWDDTQINGACIIITPLEPS